MPLFTLPLTLHYTLLHGPVKLVEKGVIHNIVNENRNVKIINIIDRLFSVYGYFQHGKIYIAIYFKYMENV